MGREREGSKQFLGNFEGILQSDGYGAYNHSGGAGIVHAACWAHARRKFFEGGQTQSQRSNFDPIVAQMDELFATDEKSRKENLDPSDRHLLRLEKAKPLLEQIKTAIQAQLVAMHFPILP
jgi:transposase